MVQLQRIPKNANEKRSKIMEKQIITVKIITKGEKCELSDAEIKEWYEKKIAGLFDPAYGKPEISVGLERTEY